MFRAAIIGATMLGAVACMSPTMAQQQETPPPPCTAEQNTHMDFWVGTWDAKWVDAEGVEQHGTNTITKELGGCMVLEQFDGNPGNNLLGHSISQYVPRLDAWKQVWMDNQAGFYPLTGGMEGGDFVLHLDRAHENVPYIRMLFTNISQTSFDWHWQRSADEGETWSDSWYIHYTRTE